MSAPLKPLAWGRTERENFKRGRTWRKAWTHEAMDGKTVYRATPRPNGCWALIVFENWSGADTAVYEGLPTLASCKQEAIKVRDMMQQTS